MRIFLISGISGSGKSVALNVLEDAGFFCVDNLPPVLLPQLIQTLGQDKVEKVAIAIDARSASSLTGLISSIEQLKLSGHQLEMIFLTAKTDSLIIRFSETRRSHPLSHRLLPGQNPNDPRTLIECIEIERKMLTEMEEIADVIDTSGLKTNQLRSWIKELIQVERSGMTILFESFGFKVGVPLNADFVFDVRALPNPYYDVNLRALTGQDLPVQLFLEDQPDVLELINDIAGFIEKWMQSFKNDNRSYLTICIGCTGGQHRSVYIVEELAKRFSTNETVVVRHREIQ